MLKRLSILLMFTLLVSQVLMAQVTSSSMSGSVKGVGGDALAGATITATHTPSGTVYTTTSKSNGQFAIPNMRVGGPYRIVVTYVGYQAQTFEDAFLKLAEDFVVDATLATTQETLANVVVTTAGRGSILNANRTGTTTNIGTRQINNLPSISRSINDLTRLTPQATSTSQGSIGGGNYRQNYITVDGADFNNTFGIGSNLPAGGSPISLDALEEISINVTPYDVKQSGFIGSAINAVTRSGTNNFAGSVYTFWRNQNQQGNKVGYNDRLTRQNLDVKTYGFRLGGPIIKNKLFFFANYETGTTVQPGQLNVAATSSNPFGSQNPNVSRPTATELDAISDYLLKNYNYATGPYQGYDNESENTRLVGRLDWNITNNHRFNVRYSQVESKSPSFVSTSRSPLGGYANGAGRTNNNALWFKNSNYFQDANFYSLSAELNSTFGKFANVFRGTYTHQNDPRSSESSVFPLVDILKDGQPFTTFGYEPFTFGNLRDVKTYSFVDYVTWNTGKHTWTVGGQADFSATKNGFQRFGTSYYTFRSWEDFVGGVKPLDYAITYSLTPGYAQAFPRFKFAQYSLYGQDEININNKLRITAGLRVDLPTYLDVEEIKSHPLVEKLSFAGGEKINTGLLPKNRLMWSPRFGFNWDVKGDRSLQLRGGSGIFTGRVPTVWIVAQSGDAGLIQFTQTYETRTADRNDPTKFVTPGPFNPDPRAYLPATPPTAGTAIPSTVAATDRDFRFPQAWKSSLALDTRLPGGIIATIEGIYNKDLFIAKGRNPNLVAPKPLNVTGYPDNRPIYPVDVKDKFINPLTAANAATNPSTPVPNGDTRGTQSFNPVVLDNAKDGYYWSVSAKLEKQFRSGWNASIAYVMSEAKNLYDGSGDQLLNTWSLTQVVGEANNPELSYANYIVPHRVVASVSYRKEWLKHLGTTISLFFEGSTQGRYSYTYSSDFNRDGQTNDLIYVPRNASEISFADFTYNGVLYTARQQSDIFFRLVEQDPYLSSRRGKYAERNGAELPWRNQLDVKFAQDIFTNLAGRRNTLQFTLDIFNFGNMLNPRWGVFKTVNASSILVPTNVNNLVPGGTVKPTFRLQTDRNQPVSSLFRENNSISSTYYMQFGLRYIFNN